MRAFRPAVTPILDEAALAAAVLRSTPLPSGFPRFHHYVPQSLKVPKIATPDAALKRRTTRAGAAREFFSSLFSRAAPLVISCVVISSVVTPVAQRAESRSRGTCCSLEQRNYARKDRRYVCCSGRAGLQARVTARPLTYGFSR